MSEKLTKREAAEKNVKAKGDPAKGAMECYPDCPFVKECPHSLVSGAKCKGCKAVCKRWLKENPDSKNHERLSFPSKCSILFKFMMDKLSSYLDKLEKEQYDYYKNKSDTQEQDK